MNFKAWLKEVTGERKGYVEGYRKGYKKALRDMLKKMCMCPFNEILCEKECTSKTCPIAQKLLKAVK